MAVSREFSLGVSSGCLKSFILSILMLFFHNALVTGGRGGRCSVAGSWQPSFSMIFL